MPEHGWSAMWGAARPGRLLALSAVATGAASVSLALEYLLTPSALAEPFEILLTLALVMCVSVVFTWPRSSWAAACGLFVSATLLPDYGLTAYIFIILLMAAAVAYAGHVAHSVIGSALVVYAGSINVPAGIHLPKDLVATLVWAVGVALAIFSGYALGKGAAQRELLLRQWREDDKRRRRVLAQSLHDSVAQSLTSAVMRAEALQLAGNVDAASKTELEAIADDARASMAEVRRLVRTLDIDSAESRPAESTALTTQLADAARYLGSHGFQVEFTPAGSPSRVRPELLLMVHHVLRELTTNIIKYADRDAPVTITASDQPEGVTVTLTNTAAAAPRTVAMHTGLGLDSATALAASAGARLSVSTDAQRWSTHLRLPAS